MATLPLAGGSSAEAERPVETSQKLEAAVGRNVMDKLGRPKDLFQVAVRRLWDDHYRVNILTGADGVSAQIVNSFFVSADNNGNILESTPTVTRKYGPNGVLSS